MPIETWFPLAIYYTILEDAPAHKGGLVEVALALEKGREKPEKQGAWTGDVNHADCIHDDPRFNWIVGQLETHVQHYIKALGLDFSKVDIYIQRSWPVISRKEQKVSGHSHHNANISAVYYVSVPEGEPGSLIFYNDAKLNELSPGLGTNQTKAYAEYNVLNYRRVTYHPTEGQLVLFPAKQRHGVSVNKTDAARISLAFDIVLVAAEEGLYEFLMPTPAKWKKINKLSTG